MRWQILSLREFDADVERLASGHGFQATEVEAAVRAEFEDPFKAQRLEKLVESGAAGSGVDRLAGSRYPPSIRIRCAHSLRVTAWLFPSHHHAVLVHAFHKSSDPDYRHALQVHDARLEGYFEGLAAFVA